MKDENILPKAYIKAATAPKHRSANQGLLGTRQLEDLAPHSSAAVET